MTTKLVIYDYDICGKSAYYSENANADGSIKSYSPVSYVASKSRSAVYTGARGIMPLYSLFRAEKER